MRLRRRPLLLALAVVLVGCGGRVPAAGSPARAAPSPVPDLLRPPSVSVNTGMSSGVAKQYGGYEWTSQGRTVIADGASADYFPAQALAGVAGTPCAPSATVRLIASPPPDTVQLNLVAGPAPGSAKPSGVNAHLAFIAPAAPGTYDYRLDANWSGGRYATYFFRLKVA